MRGHFTLHARGSTGRMILGAKLQCWSHTGRKNWRIHHGIRLRLFRLMEKIRWLVNFSASISEFWGCIFWTCKSKNYCPPICCISWRLQGVVDEDDQKLRQLCKDYGDSVCNAVKAAMAELNEYNPRGRHTMNELWNFREGRKATTKEVVKYISDQLKTNSSQSDNWHEHFTHNIHNNRNVGLSQIHSCLVCSSSHVNSLSIHVCMIHVWPVVEKHKWTDLDHSYTLEKLNSGEYMRLHGLTFTWGRIAILDLVCWIDLTLFDNQDIVLLPKLVSHGCPPSNNSVSNILDNNYTWYATHHLLERFTKLPSLDTTAYTQDNLCIFTRKG